MRRFDIGPLIVAVGSLVLLVSLFLDWYGDQTAWGAFEVADVLMAALAVAALVAAAGHDRRPSWPISTAAGCSASCWR